MKSKFTAMFPLPPSIAEGKSGNSITFLNPITETAHDYIDYGITDSSLFILAPNESKKWCDGFMSPYNYINKVDAIELQGAKCHLQWVDKLVYEIGVIHTEFYTGGVGVRTAYTERNVGRNTQKDIVKIGAPSNPYAKPCTPVTGITTAKKPPETRKWIHNLQYIHPDVDKQIEGLLLFKPVSEHMGENVITYNSDVAAIDVHDWKQPTKTDKNLIDPECVKAYGTPHVLREIIRERMIEEEPNEINTAWTKLNSYMHDNMTIEIDLTTEMGTGLWTTGTRDPREPHGVCYVNDKYHPIDYIDPIKVPVANDLFGYLTDACQLVNHMYQIYNRVKSEHRSVMYSPAITKTVDNDWIIYKPEAPIGGYEPAPILVDFELDKWGYSVTQTFNYTWPIGVGLEIEETYPRKKLGSGTFEADINGNKLKNTITYNIDNKHLIPELDLVKPPV